MRRSNEKNIGKSDYLFAKETWWLLQNEWRLHVNTLEINKVLTKLSRIWMPGFERFSEAISAFCIICRNVIHEHYLFIVTNKAARFCVKSFTNRTKQKEILKTSDSTVRLQNKKTSDGRPVLSARLNQFNCQKVGRCRKISIYLVWYFDAFSRFVR